MSSDPIVKGFQTPLTSQPRSSTVFSILFMASAATSICDWSLAHSHAFLFSISNHVSQEGEIDNHVGVEHDPDPKVRNSITRRRTNE
jgi:hypothetical protein